MAKSGPLVSICMPAYNAGKYVQQAVDSILNQTYKNIELIIVNDGSADDTANVLGQITDKRVKVFHQENKGQCAAANAAYKESTGGIIKFMDADDLISPNFIEDQVKLLNGKSDVIISAAWGRFYNDDLSTFSLIPSDVWQDLLPNQWLIKSWIKANAMMQCALWLIPREIIEISGLWDESLSLINDLDFFTRVILSSKKILFQKDAILYYRSGIGGSLSDQKSDKALLSAFTSIDNATKTFAAYDSSKLAIRACANVWQNFIFSIYPNHPVYLKSAELRVQEFGGADLPFPCGGFTKALVSVFGWKTAKKLKLLMTNGPVKVRQ